MGRRHRPEDERARRCPDEQAKPEDLTEEELEQIAVQAVRQTRAELAEEDRRKRGS